MKYKKNKASFPRKLETKPCVNPSLNFVGLVEEAHIFLLSELFFPVLNRARVVILGLSNRWRAVAADGKSKQQQ